MHDGEAGTRSLMRRSLGIACAFALGACATSNDKLPAPGPLVDASDVDAGSDASIVPGGDAPVIDDIGPSNDVRPLDAGCASSTVVAKQAPASLVFVLDRSESMAAGGKWKSAVTAIITAVDQDAFDTMSLGLLATPSHKVGPPKCLDPLGLGIPKVACGNSPLPQVKVAPAGKEKSSDKVGVRSELYAWLASNFPDDGPGDATPTYEALDAAFGALRLSPVKGKRIVVLITDGTISCTSLAKPPRPAYVDPNGCDDWEEPANIVKLVKDAHDDKTAPIQTFVVGVPGSDTDGSNPNDPPYHVRLALSAFAKVGAPEVVDPACNGTFAKSGGDPARSCHFDMTKGALDAKALADNIATIRGAALGCVYDLPAPETGSLDRNKVNVRLESGSTGVDFKRRSDPKDTCATDGCWDYDADGKIELLGKACAQAKSTRDGKVTIVVGCSTLLK